MQVLFYTLSWPSAVAAIRKRVIEKFGLMQYGRSNVNPSQKHTTRQQGASRHGM